MKVTADNDINSIFEKNTILQVQTILLKSRNDIEKKKEDLRVMVGERYRDLIEAADTIASMQRSAEAICYNIGNMESLCESLKQRGLIGFKTGSTIPSTDNTKISNGAYQYSIAMQVKLLVDVPEILWGLTEKKEFLNAAQLFLLAQHAHTALQLSTNSNLVLKGFPVISRQWSNIAQFKCTIIKGCNKKIKHEISNYESVLDAVTAIVLLENCSIPQVLSQVLEQRKLALISALKAKPSVVAKTQLVDFIVLFISSLEIVNSLFEKKNSGTCIVEEKLKKVSGQSSSENYISPISLLNESSVGLSFLPKTIIEFRPNIRSNIETLEEAKIQEAVEKWQKDVLAQTSPTISNLLSFTSTVKALSIIRSAIQESQKPSIEAESWKHVVTKLLAISTFSPWQCIIKDQVLERGKIIISKELVSTKDTVIKMVKNLANEVRKNSRTCREEGDVTPFVWSEAASDLPDQVGWMTASSRQTSQEKSGLFYKTRGYTKRIQNICKTLNNQLNLLLQDLYYFAPASLKDSSMAVKEMNFHDISAEKDYNHLLEFLETQTNITFNMCLQELKAIAEEVLSFCEDDEAEGEENCRSGGTILVIISRLCNAFSVVCPQLKICAGASLMGSQDTVRRVNLGVQSDTESWTSLKKELSSFSSSFMNRFLTLATQSVSVHLKRTFFDPIKNNSAEDLLLIFATWEKIPIQEEGEGGKVVQSSILVPAHPSPALSQALIDVCFCVNCISAHTITKHSQSQLEQELCLKLLSSYDELAGSVDVINQTTALQLIFDLKLIQTMLMPRDSKIFIERVSKLVNVFETSVDPFDLDVFHPHISSRVKVAATRLQVLLGILLPKDRQPVISRGSSSSNSFLSNNALPIVPSVDIPRFSNVPLPLAASKPKTSDSSLLLSIHSSTFKSSHDASSLKPLPKDLSSLSADSSGSSRSAAASLISSWFGGNS